jgi:hypothetical protein
MAPSGGWEMSGIPLLLGDKQIATYSPCSSSHYKYPPHHIRCHKTGGSHLVNAFVILKPMLFELLLEKFRTALLYVTVSLLP